MVLSISQDIYGQKFLLIIRDDLFLQTLNLRKNNATDVAITTGTNFLLNALLSNHLRLNIKIAR